MARSSRRKSSNHDKQVTRGSAEPSIRSVVPPSDEVVDHSLRWPEQDGSRSVQTSARAPGRRAWQQQALARCQLLRAQWSLAESHATEDEVAARRKVAPQFNGLLADAEEACAEVWHSPLAIMTGYNVERVWADVHAAEIMLLESLPLKAVSGYRDWTIAELRSKLSADTGSVRSLSVPGNDPLTGRRPGAALRTAYSSSAADHVRVRSFRNTIYFASLVTLVAAAVLALVGALAPTALPMCNSAASVCLTAGSTGPAWNHVLVAAIVGSAAGVLAGVASLARIRGSSVPYSVAFALGVFKAPCGALSAVLGLLLVRSVLGGEELGTGTSAGILAWVVIFGASQQLVTRLADQKGQVVLNRVKSGTEKSVAEPDD